MDKEGQLLAFLGGVLTGACIALILTPQSGEKTRNQMRVYAKNWKNGMLESWNQAKEYAEQEFEDLKEKTREAVQKEKEELESENSA